MREAEDQVLGYGTITAICKYFRFGAQQAKTDIILQIKIQRANPRNKAKQPEIEQQEIPNNNNKIIANKKPSLTRDSRDPRLHQAPRDPH